MTNMITQTELDIGLHLIDVNSRDDILHGLGYAETGNKRGPFQGIYEELTPQIDKFLDEIKPDVMIADVMAFCFGLRADERGLPLIMNVPLPLDFNEFVHGGLYPRESNSCVCCGCLCVMPNLKYSIFSIIGKFMVPAHYMDWVGSMARRMVISPIYAGFDTATHLQPNWV